VKAGTNKIMVMKDKCLNVKYVKFVFQKLAILYFMETATAKISFTALYGVWQKGTESEQLSECSD
jgi:hypothetical protein